MDAKQIKHSRSTSPAALMHVASGEVQKDWLWNQLNFKTCSELKTCSHSFFACGKHLTTRSDVAQSKILQRQSSLICKITMWCRKLWIHSATHFHRAAKKPSSLPWWCFVCHWACQKSLHIQRSSTESSVERTFSMEKKCQSSNYEELIQWDLRQVPISPALWGYWSWLGSFWCCSWWLCRWWGDADDSDNDSRMTMIY